MPVVIGHRLFSASLRGHKDMKKVSEARTRGNILSPQARHIQTLFIKKNGLKQNLIAIL